MNYDTLQQDYIKKICLQPVFGTEGRRHMVPHEWLWTRQVISRLSYLEHFYPQYCWNLEPELKICG